MARVSSKIKLIPKPKSKDQMRLCINFVRENKEIKSINYPVHSIQNAFDKMKGAKFFSVIDLKEGYWSNPNIYICIYIYIKDNILPDPTGILSVESITNGNKNRSNTAIKCHEAFLSDSYLEEFVSAVCVAVFEIR